MLGLDIDSMIEALDCLQIERSHAERILEELECVDKDAKSLRARINRIHKACETLTDKLIEAVDELG